MDKGTRLRQLREAKNVSQVEASQFLGLTKQTLYKYEKNIVTNIPSDVVERMAKYYNTTPAYIMGWDTNTAKEQLLNAYEKQITNKERQDKANALYDQYENLPADKKAQFDNFLKFLQSDSGLPHLH